MVEDEWDESLATGDAVVDEQHRDIFRLIRVVDAADDNPAELQRVLDQLMVHVDCHFTTEEDLMKSTGYVGEDAIAHIAEHRNLTNAARDAVLRYRAGELTSTKEVVTILQGWMSGHVQQRDSKLVEYIRSRGDVAHPTSL